MAGSDRYSKSERLIKEIEYFKQANKSVSSATLAEIYGFNKRTINDDLKLLEEMGFKFEVDKGRNGGFKLAKSVDLSDTVLKKGINDQYKDLYKSVSEEHKATLDAIIMEMFKLTYNSRKK